MTWPYCHQPECHNSHTQSYVESYPNRSSSDTRPWKPQGLLVTMTGEEMPAPWRRWCRTHALMHEGVAFG